MGLTFQPMIFESSGGVSAEAERVIKCLNKAVAVNTDISEEVVATQFWHRVGVDLVRANCRAFHRRLVRYGGDVLGAVGPLGGTWVLQVVKLGACDLTRARPFEGRRISFWVVCLCCYSLPCPMAADMSTR